MPLSESTLSRMKHTRSERKGGDARYRIICRHLKGDSRLCPRDYTFYVAYCSSHGIEPVAVKDKGAEPILYDGRKDVQGSSGDARYTNILATLESGGSISQADYGYLWRYCKRNGVEMPWCTARYSLAKNL